MTPVLAALAVTVAVAHAALVAFLIAGGFVSLARPAVRGWHLAVVAGVLLGYVGGWACPLTTIEKRLWVLSGSPAYDGGFLEHYLVLPVHPVGLTWPVQLAMHAVVVGAVVVPYLLAPPPLTRRRRGARGASLRAASGRARGVPRRPGCGAARQSDRARRAQ